MSAPYKTRHSKKPIIIKWLKHSDSYADDAMDFIRKHYNENEPIFRYININNNEMDRKIMDQVYKRCLQCDASIVTLDANTNEIIGVCLQDVKNCKKHGNIDGVLHSASNTMKPSPLLEVYRKCVAAINEDIKIRYPNATNIIDHAFLVVHPAWAREGITSMGIDFFHQYMAKELECDLAFAICSSRYSSKLLERRGYKEIWQKRFDQMKEDDQLLFDIEKPHENINCKVYELPRYLGNN